MEKTDCVVIGAGVVGLACARRLAQSGLETLILERHDAFGTETSARNSEVIHAGIYYPTGSLKARLCVEGKQFLYRYCQDKGIEFNNCGKLIVATSNDQTSRLPQIQAKAAENGVTDLELWTSERAQDLEPNLVCTGALWSPSTGIIDSHGLMLSYLGDAEDRGAFLALNTPVLRVTPESSGLVIETGGETPMTLAAKWVINATGLNAPILAANIPNINQQTIPKAYYCKGNYYTLSGKSPFSRLIYPMPQKDGLGVHVTIDLANACRFGPDTEWIEELDYEVNPARADSFYAAIRQYWPGLQDGTLQPDYAGIRPKITGPDESAADFTPQGPEAHQIPGLINLFGIESPGLTASAAIADYVAEMMEV